MVLKAQVNAAIVVLIIAVALGLLMKVPEIWFYTDFESTPRPPGQAGPLMNPDPSKDGIKKDSIKFSCRTNSSVSIQEMWMCDAWLYTPIKDLSLQNKKKQFPIIIMAHGIGATKDMGLDKFAQQFAKSGFMVLLFDYLHFGNSDGYPRRMYLVFSFFISFFLIWMIIMICLRQN